MVSNSSDDSDIIVDMEAGLEHLSRGTGRHLSRFVAVMEPYYRSMETARRVALLARELGIDDVVILANKVRDEADRRAIGDFCSAHDLQIVGEIPYDPSLIETERHGDAPVEQRPPGAAVTAIRKLADVLA